MSPSSHSDPLDMRRSVCKLTFLFSLAGLLLISSACSSGQVFIDSLPQKSTVHVFSKEKGIYEPLGETPLRMSVNELRQKGVGDGPATLEIRREGFSPRILVLSEMPRAQDINVTLTLNAKNTHEDQQRLNSILDRLFESQRLAKVGRYDDALEVLKGIQSEEPSLAATHEMEGGIYFIQEDYARALDAYQMALRLNPENIEVASMRKYIQELITSGKGREPAASQE